MIRTRRCISMNWRARSSDGSIPRSTTRRWLPRKTKSRPNRPQWAGAIRSSIPTATARSPSRGRPLLAAASITCCMQPTPGAPARSHLRRLRAAPAAAGSAASSTACRCGSTGRSRCRWWRSVAGVAAAGSNRPAGGVQPAAGHAGQLQPVFGHPESCGRFRLGRFREPFPGYLVRVRRGNNPPETCTTQIFKVPSPGLDPRGVDIDSNGVVWTALAASSHLASFDVRKCTDLNGPAKSNWTAASARTAGALFQTDGPTVQGHRHADGLPLLQLDRPAGRLRASRPTRPWRQGPTPIRSSS